MCYYCHKLGFNPIAPMYCSINCLNTDNYNSKHFKKI